MADDLKVSYRLGEPYSSVVREQAAERCLSPHQYARLRLVNDIERTDVLDLKDEIGDLRRLLERLVADFNAALE